MMNKTEDFIEKHIERIIREFNFLKRRTEHPDECPCYGENKPCHDISPEKLNCFLCYCPEYDSSKSEGGCRINSQDGKWFYHDNLSRGRVWDCSDCSFPNEEENVRKYLRKLFS